MTTYVATDDQGQDRGRSKAEAGTVERVNYGSWLRTLIAWDGLLPGCIVILPTAIEILFPNRRGAIEIAALILPITAFFLRVRAGKHHIASNRCSVAFRRFQFCVFCFAIFPLVLIDCFLVLSHVMPKGALFEADTDWLIWVILFAIYLTLMAVAMYPGRDAPSPANSPLTEFGV
jgi:hypothetical protein